MNIRTRRAQRGFGDGAGGVVRVLAGPQGYAPATTLGEHYGAITAANLQIAHTQLETGRAVDKIVLEEF